MATAHIIDDYDPSGRSGAGRAPDSTGSDLSGYEARANVFKALGHPARLAMLDALSQGERCVCELRDLVGSDMSTVSRHLAVLKECGVVAARRQGNQMFYSLRMGCLSSFLHCVDNFLRMDAQCRLAQLPDLRGV